MSEMEKLIRNLNILRNYFSKVPPEVIEALMYFEDRFFTEKYHVVRSKTGREYRYRYLYIRLNDYRTLGYFRINDSNDELLLHEIRQVKAFSQALLQYIAMLRHSKLANLTKIYSRTLSKNNQ
ncbi:MAG: hypothetical protein DRJ40_07310 [Thermoprotei archaeon]|nr:MAG: hypothetical protein DRJ40_07310 [Thermoprotei archaeon]